MLQNSTVTPVIPVNDLASCKKFYQEKLGMKPRANLSSGELILSCNGTNILLREVRDAKPTGLTEITFEVSDIRKEVSELESRGVMFEDYTEPSFRTDQHHIHTEEKIKSAWFRDPAGNMLCIHQLTEARA